MAIFNGPILRKQRHREFATLLAGDEIIRRHQGIQFWMTATEGPSFRIANLHRDCG